MTEWFRHDFTTVLGSWTPSSGTNLAAILSGDSLVTTSAVTGGVGNRFTLNINPLPAVPDTVTVSIHCKGVSAGVTITQLQILDASGNLVAGGGVSVAVGTSYSTQVVNLSVYPGAVNIDGAWTFLFQCEDEALEIDHVLLEYTASWGTLTQSGASTVDGWSGLVGSSIVEAFSDAEDAHYLNSDEDPGFTIQSIELEIDPTGLPTLDDVQLFLRLRSMTGSPKLFVIGLFDAADTELFASYWNHDYSGAAQYSGRNLTKNGSAGTPDTSGPWRLELTWYLDAGEAAALDWVVATYNAGSGGGGGGGDIGPGRQVGKNASFFLSMCGPFGGF